MEDNINPSAFSAGNLGQRLGELLVVEASIQGGACLRILDGRSLLTGHWVDVGELHVGGTSVEIIHRGLSDTGSIEHVGLDSLGNLEPSIKSTKGSAAAHGRCNCIALLVGHYSKQTTASGSTSHWDENVCCQLYGSLKTAPGERGS